MSTSEFDAYRPPEQARRRGRGRRRGGPGRGAGAADGSREMPTVPEAEFESYYDRPIVKPPPWGNPIATYLFLGGVAGGSALLGVGGQLTGNQTLRRNSRLAALAAAVWGSASLIGDLGRPTRFLNMFRTFKVSSPMSVGAWILGAFGTASGIAATAEVDDMTGRRAPLGPLRGLLHWAATPAGVATGALAAPLAAYTGVLLADTANPTWNAAKDELAFVFVGSASLASGGLAMITTPVEDAHPARILAVTGAAAELVASELMERRMDQVAAEPLHDGTPGALLRWSKRLVIAGGIGTLFAGRSRALSVISGAALVAGSALTRYGVLQAGLNSAKDPRYVVVPQKQRLKERRDAGVVDDSVTTAG
ncbi:MAG: polysulfide reductase NrfD [Tessaracoccus sp.]|uniref:NrfD/PsrC family molybdoenzyme membrane anchor subunit n=1 Tax=Tessaracoccus sp. TaxID=1971211 RepID=UPI001EB734C0|nr:NrfD/PsrC family molybdoenzyme membrane anchor subunit [Tessaracoccus sp.]MBK7821827.1 polysulfide reductase NrfD [Tessaracoccus sp.]